MRGIILSGSFALSLNGLFKNMVNVKPESLEDRAEAGLRVFID